MGTFGHRRLVIVLGALLAGSLALCGYLGWNYGSLAVQVAFANEQTQIFDEMWTQALRSEPAEAADCLAYVVAYYPTGTKQEAGSTLDRIVERQRAHAVREILTHLRARTGDDLGESPEAWVRKYATNQFGHE